MRDKEHQPAFPIPKNRSEYEDEKNGMTMRQYYKAKAMQALLTHDFYEGTGWEYTVKASSEIADAMLAEDEQHEKGGQS